MINTGGLGKRDTKRSRSPRYYSNGDGTPVTRVLPSGNIRPIIREVVTIVNGRPSFGATKTGKRYYVGAIYVRRACNRRRPFVSRNGAARSRVMLFLNANREGDPDKRAAVRNANTAENRPERNSRRSLARAHVPSSAVYNVFIVRFLVCSFFRDERVGQRR